MSSTTLRVAVWAVLSLPTFAASIYTVSGTNGNSNPVSAEADFGFANNQLFVSLTNTLADPAAANQLLTGITFTFTGGTYANNVGSVTNLTGTTRNITSSTSWTDTPINTSTANWTATNTGSTFNLFFNGATYSIIGDPGPGPKYDSNSSIVANNGHNPFLAGTPVFTLSVPGVTSTSNLSGVTFFFGTGREFSIAGVPCTSNCGGGGESVTPEPVSYLLAGTGLIGIYFLRRRRAS